MSKEASTTTSSSYSSFYVSSSESSGSLGRILGKAADVADVRDELFGLSKDESDVGGENHGVMHTLQESKGERPDTIEEAESYETYQDENNPEPFIGQNIILQARTQSSRLDDDLFTPRSAPDLGTPKSIPFSRSYTSNIVKDPPTPKSISHTRTHSGRLEENAGGAGFQKSIQTVRTQSGGFDENIGTPKSIPQTRTQSSRLEENVLSPKSIHTQSNVGSPKSISLAKSRSSRLEQNVGTPKSISSAYSRFKDSAGTPKSVTNTGKQASPREKPATPKVKTSMEKAFRVRITAEQLDREFYSSSYSAQPSMSASAATEEPEKAQEKGVTEEPEKSNEKKADEKHPLEDLFATLIPSCYGTGAKCFNEPLTTEMQMPFSKADIPVDFKHFTGSKCFAGTYAPREPITKADFPVSIDIIQRFETDSPSFLVLAGLEMISIGIAKSDEGNECDGRLEEAVDRWVNRIDTRVSVGKVSYGTATPVKKGIPSQKLTIETPELLSMSFEEAEEYLPEDQLSLLALLKDKDFTTAADFVATMIKEDTQKYGELDLTVAMGMQNLAMLCLLTNRVDEAIYHYKRAVEAKRAILGEGEVAILSETLNELAVALHSRGDVEDASIVLKEAVFMHGDMQNARILSNILNNIGCTMFQSGRPTHALSFLERSLLIQKLNPEHSTGAEFALLNHAITKTNTGHAKLFLGQPDEALELFDESTIVLESVLGEENITVKATKETIGKVKVLRAIETYAQTIDTTASF